MPFNRGMSIKTYAIIEIVFITIHLAEHKSDFVQGTHTQKPSIKIKFI